MSLAMIPGSYKDLLADETRAFVHLATVMDDKSPQVTPVWFNTNGEFILINSKKGRVKDKNMRERPKVALLIMDPKDEYRFLMLRGTVIEIREAGAKEHIDALAGKYTSEAKYKNLKPGDVRVTYVIEPFSVYTH